MRVYVCHNNRFKDRSSKIEKMRVKTVQQADRQLYKVYESNCANNNLKYETLF